MGCGTVYRLLAPNFLEEPPASFSCSSYPPNYTVSHLRRQ